jgi:hypothetical protein
MKKLFLTLLLPAQVLFGQHFQLIPDFKSPALPAPGNPFKSGPVIQFPFQNGISPSGDTLGDLFKIMADGKMSMTNPELLARFSHRTEGGSVYLIEPDQMPCLVPELKRMEKMPGSNPRRMPAEDPMPNKGPRIKLNPDPGMK